MHVKIGTLAWFALLLMAGTATICLGGTRENGTYLVLGLMIIVLGLLAVVIPPRTVPGCGTIAAAQGPSAPDKSRWLRARVALMLFLVYLGLKATMCFTLGYSFLGWFFLIIAVPYAIYGPYIGGWRRWRQYVEGTAKPAN